MRIFLSILAFGMYMPFNYGQNPDHTKTSQTTVHKVIVEEVLHTTSYTYLLAKENDQTQWLAIPKREIKPGETYYYQGGNEMKNFKSKELNRTFDSVMFLGGIVGENEVGDQKNSGISSMPDEDAGKPDIHIDPAEGGITIAELYSNKDRYAGKRVKVRGMVTKFSANIMGTNWIHIQDGTDFEGDNDLTVTSDMRVSKGDVITLEGTITIDKDFGYGYFYKVIMEDSNVIK